MRIIGYVFVVLLVLTTFIFKTGIYQNSIIYVDNIKIHRMPWYKFTFIPNKKELSFIENNMYLLSLNSIFQVKKNNPIFFKFEGLLSHQKVALSFIENKSTQGLVIKNIKQSQLQVSEDEKCIYEYDTKNNFQLYGLLKQENIIFVLGGNEDSVLSLKNDICN